MCPSVFGCVQDTFQSIFSYFHCRKKKKLPSQRTQLLFSLGSNQMKQMKITMYFCQSTPFNFQVVNSCVSLRQVIYDIKTVFKFYFSFEFRVSS